MFSGTFDHNLDDKSRLTIPAKFRHLLEDGAYVLQGFDGNLMVMSSVTFKTISERVNKMSLTNVNARLLRRMIFAPAHQVDLDKIGRILIPQKLRENADIASEVVLVGVGDFLEIWSPESWQAQNELMLDAEVNAQRFEMFDISTRDDG
jgi:MraZ protein